MSMDTVDDLQAAEDTLGALRAQAERCREATDSASFFDAVSHLIAMAGEPFVRWTCEAVDFDCDETCDGYHPAEVDR